MRKLITSLTDMGIIASPGALKLLQTQKNPMEMIRHLLMGRGEILYLEERDIKEVLEELQTFSGIPDSANTIHVEVPANTPVESPAETHAGSGKPALLASSPARPDSEIGKGGQLEPGNAVNEVSGTAEEISTGEKEAKEAKETKAPGRDRDEENGRIDGGSVSVPVEPVSIFDTVQPAKSESGSVPPGVIRYRPIAAEYAEDFEIVGDITGKSLCEGKISDFSKYFQDRLSRLRAMLKRRPEMLHARSIYNAKKTMDRTATIGIVTGVSNTDHGISVEIEDEEDTINVFISRNSPVFKDVGTIVNDEVIGVVGSVKLRKRNAVIYPDAVFRPHLPTRHRPNFADEEVSAAFVSDLHIGSKTFLGEEWKQAMDFLSGKHPDTREIASRIKYLVLPGDVVDGIGVYPGQDEDLDISDLFLQYQALAEDLHSLPDHIRIIVMPGNHDGVRVAEPQPALPSDVTRLFSGENITFTGNPITLLLHGVRILLYHGRSMDDLITAIPGLSYTHPIEAMREMLKRRHLAPIYGGKTPLAPEYTDGLIIDEVPDIFVTGHVHTTQLSSFHNIMLINASTWQDQTDYQKMRDIVPDPAKVPVVRLDTLTPEILSFR